MQLGEIDSSMFYSGAWPQLTVLLFITFTPFMLLIFLNVITALMTDVMGASKHEAANQYMRECARWACFQDHMQKAVERIFKCWARGQCKGYLHWLVKAEENSSNCSRSNTSSTNSSNSACMDSDLQHVQQLVKQCRGQEVTIKVMLQKLQDQSGQLKQMHDVQQQLLVLLQQQSRPSGMPPS